jgi:hypothetical protein
MIKYILLINLMKILGVNDSSPNVKTTQIHQNLHKQFMGQVFIWCERPHQVP